MQYAQNMLRTIGMAILAAFFMASMPNANAAVQTYSFSGMLDSDVFAGSFSFDDLSLSPDSYDPLLTIAPLTSLSMNYRGISYSLADAMAAPDASYYDGAFLGLSFSTAGLSFVPGLYSVSEAFITDGMNSADVIYAPVPEPESYAMLLAGLGLLGFAARRRRVS